MSNGRLTNYVRDTIVVAMTDYLFKTRIEDAEAKVGQIVYEHLMTGTRAAIPHRFIEDGWVRTAKEVELACGDGEDSYSYAHRYLSLPRHIPVNWRDGKSSSTGSRFYLEIHHGDVTPVGIAVAELAVLEKARGEYLRTLRRVLKTATTVKGLLALLPEAKDFLPREEAVTHPVAVQTDVDFVQAVFAAKGGSK